MNTSADITASPTNNPLLSAVAVVDRFLKCSDLSCDGRTIKEKTMIHSVFQDVRFKDAIVEDCVFTHSHFERCYFRKATLRNVNFVDCFFKDCRFDDAEFIRCKLEYAEFHNCSLTYQQVRSTLPQYENLLWRLARNLRVNAETRGQTEDYRRFLLTELNASIVHNHKKAFDWNDAYYKKYSTWERLGGLWRWLILKTEGVLWGHGEIPSRVVMVGAVLIVVFALLFYSSGIEIINMPTEGGFLEYLGFSAAAFTTSPYGDFVPGNTMGRLVVTLESALGLLLFGFLAAALYRRVSKR